MKMRVGLLIVTAVFLATFTDAQVIIHQRRGYPPPPHPRKVTHYSSFEPSLNISVGYGFPALDKNYLPEYYEAYQGNISQTGPVNASIDYQFSRRMSIGLLATHGTVSAPYFDFNSDPLPAFTAKFDNWSVMLNLVNYFGNMPKVDPYLRTAIGFNSWKQNYTDVNGNKVFVEPAQLPDLAYQLGLGAKFNLSKNAGLFLEAGYGKYIFQGGLAFKFR